MDDTSCQDVIHRQSPASKSNLGFLRHSAANDKSDSSSELAKFGLLKSCAVNLFSADSSDYSNSRSSANQETSSKLLNFGTCNVGLESPIIEEKFNHAPIKFGSLQPMNVLPNKNAKFPIFVGADALPTVWKSIPDSTLYHILDLWQAGYSNDEVKNSLDIISLPSADYIHHRLYKCSCYFGVGHMNFDCTASKCNVCNLFTRACCCN